jgi:predicted nuclease of predicted toxin-antitoxin system
MRVKLDENLDPRQASLFIMEGHDADTVIGEGISGVPDEGIYEICIATHRILITLDLDFSNPLRFPPEKTPGIIVLRPPRPTLSLITALLSTLLPVLRAKPLDGRLWILEPGRIREYESYQEKDR